MLPASATAVLAVPDRPGPERLEAKDPDPSDGRFAGWMAHFVQAAPSQPDRTAKPPEAPAPEPEPSIPQGAGGKQPLESQAGAAKVAGQDPQGTDAASAPPPTSKPGASRPGSGSEAVPASQVNPGSGTTPGAASPGTAPWPPLGDPTALGDAQAQPDVEAAPAGAKLQAHIALTLAPPSAPKAGGLQTPAVPSAAAPAPASLGPATVKPTAKGGETEPLSGHRPHSSLAVPSPEAQAEAPIPGLRLPEAAPGETPATPLKAEGEPLKPGLKMAGPALMPLPAPQPEAAAGAALAAATAPQLPPPPGGVQSATATPAPAGGAPAPATLVQLEGGLRWMLKSGTQEARMQLHPESLGQVTIHLKVEGGEVHARLWVTEPASAQAVQEGRPHLEQSLKEQGLQLGSFDLQQGHRPFQEAPSAPAASAPRLEASAGARQETPAAPAPSILNAHRVELYA